MKDLFLGIDLGTSAVKALAVGEDGAPVSSGSALVTSFEPRPAWQEQDLDVIREAMVAAMAEALSGLVANKVAGLAFSSAMHGFMPVDGGGAPLASMMTWADGRARDQAAELRRGFGGEELFARSGCPPAALYYPARLLWLRANKPDIFSSAARFVSIKDCLVHELTGEWAGDRSHASSNGLLNLAEADYDPGLLDYLGVEAGKFPRLIEPDEPAGKLAPEAARLLGLPPGIPVAPGAGDGGLANLGSGAVDPGQAAVTIGTSGAMRKILPRHWSDPEGKIWCYYLAEGRYYAGGAINSGGIVLRWLRDGLLSHLRDRALSRGKDPYAEILDLASRIGPGADGLVFLPYIHGERTPYWNADARGVLFGLASSHRDSHLARAALDGICLAMRHVFELLESSPGELNEIRASGGFARSDIWLSALADVLGEPVSAPAVTEGSALGACFLAMKAAGAIDSISAAREMTPVDRVIEPDMENHEVYCSLFPLFKRLYGRLEEDFADLARLREGGLEPGGGTVSGHRGKE